MRVLLFLCLLLGCITRGADAPPVLLPLLDETERSFFREALQFAMDDADAAAVTRITERILSRRPSDWSLLTLVFEAEVARKDRASLRARYVQIWNRNDCPQSKNFMVLQLAPALCQNLWKLWSESLESIFFYEESAVKMQKARAFLDKQNCSEALSVLKEVESREAPFRSLLEEELRAAVCLMDADAIAALQSRLARMESTQ